jgi:hypothetical protein
MKYSTHILFCDEIEDDATEDEIDKLFSQLEQIEPPPSLIEDILASVASLPLPHYLLQSPEDAEPLWETLEGPAVHYPHQLPS